MRRSLVTVGATMVAAAILFAACSGEETQDAAAPAGTAAAQTDPASSDAVSADEASVSTGVSFASDVQPILEQNCVSCHTDNGPGTTHLVMDTVDDVHSIADFVAFRVEEEQMPPWPQSGLQEIAYQFDLSMSDEDRQTIIDWAAEGAPLDVDPQTPLASQTQTFPPIDPDLVLTADQPYPGSDKLDDYRCRIIDPELEETEWVTSIDTRPDETRVLHHSLIFKLPADLRSEADAFDGNDGAPGWNCQTVPRLSDGLLEQVAGWAPGTGPVTLPEGSGIRFDAGDAFVVQWHYHFDSGPLPDNSGIGVEFASDEEVAAAGGELDEVRFPTLLAPVEIPCATFESGPLCDRDAALQRVQQEFGAESSLIPTLVNQFCGVSPEDFAHFTDGVASSSCDLPAPDGDVVSIWPHMHELGSTYRLTLNPDTPEEQILVDIGQWDFNWQLGYYPVETLTFDSDDVLRLECGWDRSLWPAGVESRYVVWAEGTQDEMCFTGLAIN